MLGADIYRYQTITDWADLARKVGFLWVKGTDGSRRAPSPADERVRQARAHGIPVGLYHYAQLVPRPEAQADVLAAEVRRLDADQVAPALDLESPHKPGPAAREFALRFLRRLVDKHRFPRVAIYANASMLAAIRPDTWDIPGLVIWCAHYGPNDGERHSTFRPYTGRVDVHQYTDRGSLPGVAGAVDLNHALRSPLMEDDVTLTDADMDRLIDRLIHRLLRTNITNIHDRNAGREGPWLQDALRWIDVRTQSMEAVQQAMRVELGDDEGNIIHAVRTQNLTPEELAEQLRDQLPRAVLDAMRALLNDDDEGSIIHAVRTQNLTPEELAQQLRDQLPRAVLDAMRALLNASEQTPEPAPQP